jgi:hypothetical protein
MKLITKEDFGDKTIVGKVGFVVTHIVDIKEPILISELIDNWIDYIDDEFELEINGLEECDCSIQ